MQALTLSAAPLGCSVAQIRGDRKLRFSSFRKRSDGGGDGLSDDGDDGEEGEGVFDPPEIDAAGPVTHSGEAGHGCVRPTASPRLSLAVSTRIVLFCLAHSLPEHRLALLAHVAEWRWTARRYHESGHPIYGNLPGYYASSATDSDLPPVVAPPVEATVSTAGRSPDSVQYTAVNVESGSVSRAALARNPAAPDPTREVRDGGVASGGDNAGGGAADGRGNLPMTFSAEETYDNPKVAAAAFRFGTDEFLPGSAYDMSDTATGGPRSPRQVTSDLYNKDVRNGRVDPMQVCLPLVCVCVCVRVRCALCVRCVLSDECLSVL